MPDIRKNLSNAIGWRTQRKIVVFESDDCHSNDIIQQINGCTVLFWHFSQSNPRDILIAKPVLMSLKHAGIKMFPNFETAWHFDDKVAQKYLLEILDIKHVPSYVFVKKQDALNWINTASFPKVFKLRGGAGSANVRLLKSKKQAKSFVIKAFSSGFSLYEGWGSFKDNLKKFLRQSMSFTSLLKSFYRIFIPPDFVKAMGREYGYVYFQDFIPDNQSDYRVIIINDKAFAIKRGVRPGDFRASGSGFIEYDKSLFRDSLIKQSFEIAQKIKSQCIALDFIIDKDNNYLLVEISYGFAPHAYIKCEGYWDDKLNWFPGKINPYGWIIELSQEEK